MPCQDYITRPRYSDQRPVSQSMTDSSLVTGQSFWPMHYTQLTCGQWLLKIKVNCAIHCTLSNIKKNDDIVEM